MPTPTPIPSTSPTIQLSGIDPWLLIVIIIGALVALLLSLWMVYSYINNIRLSATYREILQ